MFREGMQSCTNCDCRDCLSEPEETALHHYPYKFVLNPININILSPVTLPEALKARRSHLKLRFSRDHVGRSSAGLLDVAVLMEYFTHTTSIAEHNVANVSPASRIIPYWSHASLSARHLLHTSQPISSVRNMVGVKILLCDTTWSIHSK